MVLFYLNALDNKLLFGKTLLDLLLARFAAAHRKNQGRAKPHAARLTAI
jgi:hypothetical protein